MRYIGCILYLLVVLRAVNTQEIGVRPECPPVCEIFCEFGHELDQNGCELCPCKADPCLNHNCRPGDRCEVSLIVCVTTPCPRAYAANCVPNTDHPGTCPEDDTITTCEIKPDACTDDSQCADDEKCCSVGCGKTCVQAISLCATVHCQNGYTCNPKNGNCELDSLCALVLCIQGSTCDPRTGKCRPIDPCGTVRCPSGTRCVNGKCIPDKDLCDHFRCRRGQRCELYPPCLSEIPENCQSRPVCRPCPRFSCPLASACRHGIKLFRDKDGCVVCKCKGARRG